MENEVNRGEATNRGETTDREVERIGGQVLVPEDGLDQEELFDPESEDSLARQAALLTGSFGDDEPESEAEPQNDAERQTEGKPQTLDS